MVFGKRACTQRGAAVSLQYVEATAASNPNAATAGSELSCPRDAGLHGYPVGEEVHTSMNTEHITQVDDIQPIGTVQSDTLGGADNDTADMKKNYY